MDERLAQAPSGQGLREDQASEALGNPPQGAAAGAPDIPIKVEPDESPTKKDQEIHRSKQEAEKLGAAMQQRGKKAGAAIADRRPEGDVRAAPAQ
eukprot:6924180-Heterocapsa_arctica.AAC.1